MSEKIAGYRLTDRLHVGENFIVQRGEHLETQAPVIIKYAAHSSADGTAQLKLRDEYKTLKKLDGLPGVPAVKDCITEHEETYLILHDIGAQKLSEAFDFPLKIDDFLMLAKKMTDIVDAIHRKGVIHKKLSPSNFVYDAKEGRLQLVDFGLSTFLEREDHDTIGTTLEGELCYISPEQTGRMNSSLDYRSDYYSLGVCFYTLLLGAPPFESDDPMELIHAHIAKEAAPIFEQNGAIPRTLSDIVAKLIRKDVIHRYQSAQGLLMDLDRCETHQKEEGHIPYFEIATEDYSTKLKVSEKLYGRDDQIQEVISIFQKATEGQLQVLMVGGYSGVGKTSLINEVQKEIVKKKALFIHGKFDQYNRGTAYSGISLAFNELIQHVLGKDKETIDDWRKKILDILHPNERLFFEIIPDLQYLLPDAAELSPMEPAVRQYILRTAFGRFINLFATEDSPLVLFLDDLQWIDSATVSLLTDMTQGNVSSYFLIIGSFRDNEVTDGHILRIFNDELKKRDMLREINLSPLDIDDMHAFLSDSLHLATDAIQDLATLVFKKTEGNPFYMTQLINTLYDEDILRFDRRGKQWTWDLDEIERKSASENVVEFMIRRLKVLTEESQHILHLAACVGNEFSLELLSTLCESSPAAVADMLGESMLHNMIVPLGQGYRYVGLQDDDDNVASTAKLKYRFFHDRIQQASYSLKNEEDQKRTHLKLARIFRKQYPDDDPASKEFLTDIVNQWNKAKDFITDPEEKLYLVRQNLTIANRAHSAAAFESAWEHLDLAKDFLQDDDWEKDYDFMRAFYSQYAQTAYDCHFYEKGEALSDYLLKHAKTNLEKAETTYLRVHPHAHVGKIEEGVQHGLKALSYLGIKISKSPSIITVLIEYIRLRWRLKKVGVDHFRELPRMTDPEILLIMNIFDDLEDISYCTGRKMLFAISCMNMVKLTLKYGITNLSITGFGYFGLFLCGVFHDYKLGYKFGKLAEDLVAETKDDKTICRVNFLLATFIYHWSDHLSKIGPILTRSIVSGSLSGDTTYQGYAAFCEAIMEVDGHLDQKEERFQQSLSIIKEGDYQIGIDTFICAGHRWKTLREQTDFTKIYTYSDEVQESWDRLLASSFQPSHGIIYIDMMTIACLYHDYEKAKMYAGIVIRKYIGFLPALHCIFELCLFNFIASAELMHTAKGFRRFRHKLTLKTCLFFMTMWAKHSPLNFSHFVALMKGEIAAIKGDFVKADSYFDQAIALAGEHQYIRYKALICERAGLYYVRRDRRQIAALYLDMACKSYAAWGAKSKVAHLNSVFDDILRPWRRASSGQSKDAVSVTGSTLDLNTIIKASQMISREVVIDKVISKMLYIMVENVGAEYGVLVLNTKDGLSIAGTSDIKGNSRDDAALEQDNAMETFVPETLIHYVSRSHSDFVLDHAIEDKMACKDPYIAKHRVKSVLCAPILLKKQLMGILYFENNLVQGAFTKDRIRLIHLLAGQAAISLENARLYHAFERFVPRDFISLLGKSNIVELQLGEHVEKNMSILFSDIREFTNMSEKMNPQENFDFINDYLKEMSPIIRQNHGFIDKYIGDAIMALHPESTDDAILAALGIQDRLKEMNQKRVQGNDVPLRVGIGINTGNLMLGIVGGIHRREGTVISDAVNIASRIQELTKRYGCKILISESTYNSLKDTHRYDVRFIDNVMVKGKERPTKLYEVYNADQDDIKSQKKKSEGLFMEMVAHYQAKETQKAKKILTSTLIPQYPDPLYDLYLRRCEDLISGKIDLVDGALPLSFK